MLEVTALRTGDPAQVAGYRIVRRLGQGGQGVVFLGVGEGGEQVAIKRLRLEDERSRRQFAKEVGAARRVAAFCTARVITFDLEGESPYVVSEFIEGPSLQQLVRESGPLSGSRLHRLAIGTVTALAAIHQAGVVHRDLKPANVMVSADGPRVIDFGIARDMSNETTITSRVFGTPAYMAPEQIRAERVSPQTDMFAWASVMAFAATGRAPFDAKHMMAVVHRITTMEPDLTGVPPALAEVLRPCLNKDATRRPTAQQALAMLLGRPAPAHDAEDPTVVLAEGSRLARTATGDPAVDSEAEGAGQTVVTAQDVGVDPVGPGAGVGSGPAADQVFEGGQGAGGSQAGPGGVAPAQGVSPEVGGRAAGNVPGAGSGHVAPGSAAEAAGDAPVQGGGVGPDALGRATDAQSVHPASTRGPRPGSTSAPGAGRIANSKAGQSAITEPVTAWSTGISQDAETIPTPVPRPPGRPDPDPAVPAGPVRPGSGGPSGPGAGGRPIPGPGKNGVAGGALGKEPEFGTPEPLVPNPADPSDVVTLVRRKRLAGLGSGVGAVLLVLLLGGSMVAGGAIALRALLHHDSPGSGSQGGQSGGTADPTPSSSAQPSTTPAGAALPDWTTGEWSGDVYQPTGQITSYKVQISLQAGATQGQIEMPELGCAGALTVESSTNNTVVLSTRLEDDAWGRCVDQSTLQLTRVGSDQLLYAWKDDAQVGNDAGGTVTRA